jgi:hypothetical protein
VKEQPEHTDNLPLPLVGEGWGEGVFLNAFEIVARKNAPLPNPLPQAGEGDLMCILTASDFFHHSGRRLGFMTVKVKKHPLPPLRGTLSDKWERENIDIVRNHQIVKFCMN